MNNQLVSNTISVPIIGFVETNNNISKMSIGTFHSICAGILRRHIHHLGYNNAFTSSLLNNSKYRSISKYMDFFI